MAEMVIIVECINEPRGQNGLEGFSLRELYMAKLRKDGGYNMYHHSEKGAIGFGFLGVVKGRNTLLKYFKIC